VPLQDRVEDPDVVVVERLTLPGDRVHDRPVEGEMDVARFTVSVKPFSPLTVTVEVAVWPGRTAAAAGLAEIVKSVAITW
jgi:hypothetical protein